MEDIQYLEAALKEKKFTKVVQTRDSGNEVAAGISPEGELRVYIVDTDDYEYYGKEKFPTLEDVFNDMEKFSRVI